MRMVDLIEKKRDGGVLTDDEIRFIIRGFTDGSIPDYQMSAFAMTVFYKGMTDHETAVLTDAMMHSGDTVDLSRFGDKSVDKHSTGGVGDKTTLIVAPIVSSLGGKMAKMSGRGLGHTGGTVDKLESIPGYQTTLSADAFMRQVEQVGVAVIGQSGNLTPADKKLYALRDVTATIDSLPLITSSIMSKKLAAGAHSIVLDVKIGSGAFMKTLKDGQKLAESMVRIGRACGRNVVAVMSNMDIPLGFYIGNALEVREAAEVYGYDCIRMFILMSHYRSPLNYSGEILMQAKAALERLRTAKSNLEFFIANGRDGALSEADAAFVQGLDQYREKFDAVMDDDFNTADAISVIFEMVREINTAVSPAADPSKALAQACLDRFLELCDVLGIPFGSDSSEDPEAKAIEEKIAARQAARKAKNWAEADRIRDELKAMGITLMDTPQGVKWSKD